jgi:hypothetical protein
MSLREQQQIKQQKLNLALHAACGPQNDLAEVEDLLGLGADMHILVAGNNSLHWAITFGRVDITSILLFRGAVLEARNSSGQTALALAALWDQPEICSLLLARGADLHAVDYSGRSVRAGYGCAAGIIKSLSPLVKAQRIAELKAAWRAGSHPSQVRRRNEENWAKRWPLMNMAYGCGFLVLEHKAAQLKAAALPTDAKIPDEPTETEEQRRALRHKKVFGNLGLMQRVASFIQEEEQDEEEDKL